jgi:hypothetical protein
LGIKWNGIEQYTPVAGISGNLAALAGYSGITNPELAYKLGVNSTTLDVIDAAPKVLSEASNAAAFKAVELAKEAIVGREARAQTATSSTGGGIRLPGAAGIGAAIAVQLGGQFGARIIEKVVDACTPEKDKPCNPPEGTQCWVIHTKGAAHAGVLPHWHIYTMRRRVKLDNACQWQEGNGQMGQGVLSYQPPLMASCSSFSSF